LGVTEFSFSFFWAGEMERHLQWDISTLSAIIVLVVVAVIVNGRQGLFAMTTSAFPRFTAFPDFPITRMHTPLEYIEAPVPKTGPSFFFF